MSTGELPDFTAAPAWLDCCGFAWSREEYEGYKDSVGRHTGQWAPLDTPERWTERIDRDKLAGVIQSHLELSHPVEGREFCCSECGFAFDYPLMPESVRHSRNAEHLAYAVLAALPDLMGGGER